MSPAEISNFQNSFNFDYLENITIDEIKKLLQIQEIQLRTVRNPEGGVKSFICHWDFERKLTIKIERELVQQIKINRGIPLTLSRRHSNGRHGSYHLFIIDIFTPTIQENDNTEWEPDDRYTEFNGYNGWSDNDIYDAFEGDPENTWNVD